MRLVGSKHEPRWDPCPVSVRQNKTFSHLSLQFATWCWVTDCYPAGTSLACQSSLRHPHHLCLSRLYRPERQQNHSAAWHWRGHQYPQCTDKAVKREGAMFNISQQLRNTRQEQHTPEHVTLKFIIKSGNWERKKELRADPRGEICTLKVL